jgi:hypothetical protein
LAETAGDTIATDTKQTVKDYLASRFGVGETGPEALTPSFTNIEELAGEGTYLFGGEGTGTPIYQTEAEGRAAREARMFGGPQPAGTIPAPATGVPSVPGQGVTRPTGVPVYGGGMYGGGFSEDAGQDFNDFVRSQDPSGQGNLDAGWEFLQTPTYTRYGGGRQQRKEGFVEEERRASKADIAKMYFTARNDEITGIRSAQESFAEQRATAAERDRLAGESEEKAEREARKESRLDREAYDKRYNYIDETYGNVDLGLAEDASAEERRKAIHAEVAGRGQPESIADLPPGTAPPPPEGTAPRPGQKVKKGGKIGTLQWNPDKAEYDFVED